MDKQRRTGTMTDKKGAGANIPRTPSNWDADGMSKGSKTGAVRPTKDAYQGERKRGEDR